MEWKFDEFFGRDECILAEEGRERVLLKDYARFNGKTSLQRQYRRNGKWLTMESITINWTSKKKPEIYLWNGDKPKCACSRGHLLDAIRSICEDLLPISSIHGIYTVIVAEFGSTLDSRAAKHIA